MVQRVSSCIILSLTVSLQCVWWKMKFRWAQKDHRLQTEKDKELMLCAALWLEGAVTWQPGDHISNVVCACVSFCLCVFAHVVVSGNIWAQCSFSTDYHTCWVKSASPADLPSRLASALSPFFLALRFCRSGVSGTNHLPEGGGPTAGWPGLVRVSNPLTG